MLLFACAPATARAQATAALPPCAEPAAGSRRVTTLGGRVSIALPDGMVRVSDAELARAGAGGVVPSMVLMGDSGHAAVFVYTVNEVARVDRADYQESRQRLAETGTRGYDRWLGTEVVEQGGARWLRQAYVSRDGLFEIRHLRYIVGLDGRTVFADIIYRASARGWGRKLEDAGASL
ncbi:MAG TPA: hypothetical protein VJT67_14310, partial [Longimicrobiaceae bacterium]|nr:hypothetical protein [Longimicrobiaceae bacterium]